MIDSRHTRALETNLVEGIAFYTKNALSGHDYRERNHQRGFKYYVLDYYKVSSLRVSEQLHCQISEC
jgi:hypothetical protein